MAAAVEEPGRKVSEFSELYALVFVGLRSPKLNVNSRS
jgi:hypothetical protein